MLRKKHYLIYLFTIALGLSACATVTEQELIAAGATRMDGKQVIAHLSGKTERWPYYETYYNPDGKVETLWDKVKFKGTWEISADGKVCIKVPKWKNYCHSYLDNHGAITRIEEGKSVGVKEVVEGRKLSR